jgi:acetyl-CoA C-acetyltransferase
MAEAFIVDALSTPTDKRRDALAHAHAADMAGFVLRRMVDRNAIPSDIYGDVVLGAIDAVGPLSFNIARMCGSLQQAIHFAARAVMSGAQEAVIAGGVQTMSQIPIGFASSAAAPLGLDDPFPGSQG